MTTFQKVIKYAAIGFAILLTIGILSGIVRVVSGVVLLFDGTDTERVDYSAEFSDVEKLDINNRVGNLTVKAGESNGFRVEATNVSSDFKAKVRNGTLEIDEPDFIGRFFGFNIGKSGSRRAVITVYVPKGFTADRIKIDSGAGGVKLEDISVKNLNINAGVGDIYGRNITAGKVDIDGGVGNISFTEVDFSNVEVGGGVGNISIEGNITGKSEFDCGVGEVDIRLTGKREDYALDIDAGLGSVRVNGDKVSNKYRDTYKADNTIEIDGGVGSTEIRFGH